MKITLMRHGRPLIDLTHYSRPNEIPDFMRRYDHAELDPSVPPPSEAIKLALESTCVVCSDLSRSRASAERLGVPKVHVCDALFREVLIPSMALSFPRLPDSHWIILLRTAQMLGFSRRAESMRDARARAKRCAERLGALANVHDKILFVGHSFLNWLIANELTEMGWKGSRLASPGRRFHRQNSSSLLKAELSSITVLEVVRGYRRVGRHAKMESWGWRCRCSQIIRANIPAPASSSTPPEAASCSAERNCARSARDTAARASSNVEPQMRKLLGEFAAGDKHGMSKRLFDEFLKKQSAVKFFDDRDLNRAVLYHDNIKHFCRAALSAPNMPGTGGRIRIHQALRAVGWDINKLVLLTDLGVPALNQGLTWARTGDYDNGLGLMVNGIQYAYRVATKYDYDGAANKYSISIRYIFYDVFGLDDDDLKEFGVVADARIKSTAAMGITAWWQLQHQHGYAPLVTRMIIDRNFEAPAT